MTNATRLPADLAGALALIESLTVQRDAAEALAKERTIERDYYGQELDKATGMVEGLVAENERFRHAAAETADLLMRGALEDDLSSAQQMVAEIRDVLTTGRDIVIETSTGSRHTKWVEDAYDTIEASAHIAGENDEIKRLRAAIADAAAVMSSIYDSFRDGEKIDPAVVDIGIGCWLEKHSPGSLPEKDGD